MLSNVMISVLFRERERRETEWDAGQRDRYRDRES